jgi:hypothetical protein
VFLHWYVLRKFFLSVLTSLMSHHTLLLAKNPSYTEKYCGKQRKCYELLISVTKFIHRAVKRNYFLVPVRKHTHYYLVCTLFTGFCWCYSYCQLLEFWKLYWRRLFLNAIICVLKMHEVGSHISESTQIYKNLLTQDARGEKLCSRFCEQASSVTCYCLPRCLVWLQLLRKRLIG